METNTTEKNQLKTLVDRIESLEQERKLLADDIKDLYEEAKAKGFDVAVLKKVIALRKKPRQKRDEEESILLSYLEILESP
jgi:uncharacterized protein (UPF0335 family)